MKGGQVRFIGLDVHLDFCEIAISERGRVRSGGRVSTSPEGLRVLADSLAADDHVALEATGNALAIARRLEPHVTRVVVAARKGAAGDQRGEGQDRSS
jgi:transposase